MNRKRAFVVVMLALVVAVPALSAAAQSVEGIADELEIRGYHIGAGADITINEMEELIDRFPQFGFVALDSTPSGGADLLANTLLDAAPSRDTIVVLTADEAGAASAVHGDDALDDAFGTAFSTTGDSYLVDFEQVATALTGGPAATTPNQPPADGGSQGGGGFPIVWLLVLGAVAYFGYRMWANSRGDERAVARRFTEAKKEIDAQVAAVANQILELSDRPDLYSNAEATAHFRRASETFHSAELRLEAATTTGAFEALSDDLDDARWELAAAEALLAGRPLPDRPEDEHPEPCFFDPTHGAGVEEAQLSTAAGTRTVKVCRMDAERLRNGERPEPRTVTVGGQAVPAPTAPRSHGGRGMDALDIFSILVGGMGDAAGYRWGGGSRRRRPTVFGGMGGGFGGGVRGGRSSGGASAARSMGRSVGRARRGR
ncbi:MAG TPA: hypothetical protein VMS74_00935 [Acidimicrobiia bacterium]|nr:hypothetical protein [Acidimicrobiia bacterium]